MPKIYKLPKIGKSITLFGRWEIKEKGNIDLSKSIEEKKTILEELEEERLKKEKEIAYLKNKIIYEAKLIADRELQEAYKRSEEIIENATHQAEEIKAKAYKEGLEKAREEVYKELNLRIDKFAHEFFNLMNNITQGKQKVINDIQKHALDLILLVCENILKEKIAFNRELLLKRISAALSEITTKTKIKIALNLKDKELIEGCKDKFIKDYKLDDIEVEVDEDLGSGEFIITTELGSIDARISNQLAKIKELF